MELGRLEIIAGYFIVGTLWGATNALMEVGSKDSEEKPKPSNKSKKVKDE